MKRMPIWKPQWFWIMGMSINPMIISWYFWSLAKLWAKFGPRCICERMYISFQWDCDHLDLSTLQGKRLAVRKRNPFKIAQMKGWLIKGILMERKCRVQPAFGNWKVVWQLLFPFLPLWCRLASVSLWEATDQPFRLLVVSVSPQRWLAPRFWHYFRAHLHDSTNLALSFMVAISGNLCCCLGECISYLLP